MGNKYIEQLCLRCSETTWHRTFKRFGKGSKGKKSKGVKSLRRIVTYCLTCQKRVIVGRKKGKSVYNYKVE